MPNVFHGTNHSIAPGFAGGPGKFGWNVTPYRNEPSGKGVPGKSRTVKGLVFGLCVWAVGTLPHIFTTFVFMNVATTVVVYWTLMGLIQTPLQGIIVALIVDDRPTANE